jgi:hypothetical protein
VSARRTTYSNANPAQLGRGLAGGDFDVSGADDLAVGRPASPWASISDAGAVNVVHGAVSPLSGTGSRLFTQATPGAGNTAEVSDFFGGALDASSDDTVGGIAGAARADR